MSKNPVNVLEDLIKVQRDSAHCDDYMAGMLNGMILSKSVMTGQSPKFYTPKKKTNKIRHKKND